MTTRFRILVLAALMAMPAAHAGPATPAGNGIEASAAWLRVLPGGLPAGGYVVLRNTGDTAVDITAADSPAYKDVMLHQSSSEGGVSRMRMVHSLPVPAHGEVVLAPGGYHLMLMHARHPVKPGDHVPVTLHFSDGGSLDIDFAARPANADGPAAAASQ